MGCQLHISGFPVRGEGLSLDVLDLGGLCETGRYAYSERLEESTCRPVVYRNEAERADDYRQLLQDRTVLSLGIYEGIREEQALAGKLTLFNYNTRNGSLEIGYYLIPSFRGRGLMKRALRVLLMFLFSLEEPVIRKVYAQTGAFNGASVRLLTEAGFQRDAVLRQHHELDGRLFDDYVFSVLRGEYERGHPCDGKV